MAVGQLTGAYSWGVLFTHTYIRWITDLASARSEVTFSNYLGAFPPALEGANVLHPTIAPIFVAIVALGLVAYPRLNGARPGREWLGLQLAIWGAFLVHFVAYPMLWDRFFVVHYAFATVLTVSLLDSRAKSAT